MAKEAIEGYLVKEVLKSDGEKTTEDILGVAMTECDAKEMIEERSAYYSESPFEYSRGLLVNGIVYNRTGKSGKMIMYTYEKCIVVTGV